MLSNLQRRDAESSFETVNYQHWASNIVFIRGTRYDATRFESIRGAKAAETKDGLNTRRLIDARRKAVHLHPTH